MKYLKILSIFCIFCFVFTLSSCNNENYSNLPSGSETENPVNDDEDIELNDNEGGFMKIKIDNTIFEVIPEKTARLILFTICCRNP